MTGTLTRATALPPRMSPSLHPGFFFAPVAARLRQTLKRTQQMGLERLDDYLRVRTVVRTPKAPNKL